MIFMIKIVISNSKDAHFADNDEGLLRKFDPRHMT